MPVESSTDAPFVQYRVHASRRRHHPVAQPHHHLLPCCAEDLDLGSSPDDLDLCLSSSAAAAAAYSARHVTGDGNDTGGNSTNSQNLISTHSPPLINLSPNLSPSSETFYDFRETTRRRSFHEQHSTGHPMQHSPQVIAGYIAADDSGRKTESPARKRRKLHGASLQDVTNSSSPPPPPPIYLTRSLAEHHHRLPNSHEAARPRSRSRSRSSELLVLQQFGVANGAAVGNSASFYGASGNHGNGHNSGGSSGATNHNGSIGQQQQQQQQQYQAAQQQQPVQRKRTLPTRRASGEARTQTPPRPRRSLTTRRRTRPTTTTERPEDRRAFQPPQPPTSGGLPAPSHPPVAGVAPPGSLHPALLAQHFQQGGGMHPAAAVLAAQAARAVQAQHPHTSGSVLDHLEQ
ncbi:hypothetical protein EGW08_018278, partial [Elysia chlorotica]